MGSFRSILGLDRFFGSRSVKRAGQGRERLRGDRKVGVQPALERLESRINMSFGNLNTIAQSMQLGENALPQIPGLDASVGQMPGSRLSDIVGLNAYGNGFSTSNGSGWSQFDTQYPNANLISGFGTSGTGWNIATGLGDAATISNNVLNLTNGTPSQYNGIWNTTSIPHLDTNSWTASFTLTNSGANWQDGGSFMLQTAGASATGGSWYGSGITNGVSFSWNNYNGGGPTGGGTQFAVTTGGGTPVFNSNQTAINMSDSSTPLYVVLQYDSVTSNLIATVTQGSATWNNTYTLGNISALHNGATVGFAGGNGGAYSATTVTNFTMNQGASVSNLQSVANTVTAGLPSGISATVIPTNNGTAISAGSALTSSTTAPAYGSLPDFGLGNQANGFTIQGWFNSSNISGSSQRIIDFGNTYSSTGSNNLVITLNNSSLAFANYNTGTTNAIWWGPSTSTLSSNTWYHLTAVYGGGSSGNLTVYLNGQFLGSTSSFGTISNTSMPYSYWGYSTASGVSAWQGQQDELRIWNRQLSSTEISNNYNVQLAGNQNGLLAYYQANQGAYSNGTTLTDSSGNGKNGTLQLITNFGPATSTFPFSGAGTDGYYDQVYINALYAYTSVSQPTSVNFYSAYSGHFITPLLFTLDNGVYTVVASHVSTIPDYYGNGINVSQGTNSAALNWQVGSSAFSFAANTNYYVGFKDGNEIQDKTGYDGCIEWTDSTSNTSNQWLNTASGNNNSLGFPTLGTVSIGNTFSTASGSTFSLLGGTRNYSFNVVATSSVNPTSTLNSTVNQTGVQIQWAENSTYNAVFSTNGLDGGLHLSKSGVSYIPITVSAGVNLTLGLDSSSNLLAGVSGYWNANQSNSYNNNLDLDIGLGYLDSSIQNGNYSLSTSVYANLFDTNTNTNLTGTVNSAWQLTGALGKVSDFPVASASQFPQSSGTILVNASMPFTGQVGGQAFTTTPTLALPNQSSSVSTVGYTQPLWSLSNFDNYLALAQLDAAALVNSGLNNAGGSLASIGQTNWQQVPFSTSTVNYNWGNGLNNAAGLLYQNKLSIAGQSRIQGGLPANNYGATFSITSGTGSTATTSTVNLTGNLAAVASSINSVSNSIAAPIAYYLNNQLASSGLGCREQPNHPGYLEFYAINSAITGFQMSPYNPTSGSYVIGSTAANAFSALGFFAQPVTSSALLNGSFEGPYVTPGPWTGTVTPWIPYPANAQWTFSGSIGIAANDSPWYGPDAPNGSQALYTQGVSSISQTLLEVAGGEYELSFLATSRPDSTTYSPSPITVTIDGKTIYFSGGDTIADSQLPNTAWTPFTSDLFTLTPGTHTLVFTFSGDSSNDSDAIDDIQLNTYTLNAQQATYPAALSFQGLLDVINQPNLIPSSAAGSPTSPPVAYPASDSSSGSLVFNAGITYTSTNIPTAIQFVANVASQNQYLTPVLLSVSGGTYTPQGLASPIQVTRTGLQTANLAFTNFTPASGTTYVLGYIDGNITSTSSGATNYSLPSSTNSNPTANKGTVGLDYRSTTGTFWAMNPASITLGSTTITSTGTATTRLYSFSAYSGLVQAGQGSVARPSTDTSTNNSYIYTDASYTTAFVPTKIRYYTNISQASGSSVPSFTPMLFTSQGGGNYTVAAVGNSITPTATGLNEAEVVFQNLGSLTPGVSYLFGFQNSSTGVVALLGGASASGGWVSTTSTGLSQGSSATFSTAGIYSLDIIASQATGNPAAASSTSATSTYGQVVINPHTVYTGGSNGLVLPSAMQVYATVPSGGSGWITPLLFQQSGSGSTATFTLVAAGVSQEVISTGASQLPVEFPAAVIAALSTANTFVMGYSTQQVQLGNSGSTTVNSYSPGMVQYNSVSGNSAWLTSAGGSSSTATSGYPNLTVGSSVFSQGSTQSATVLTSGNAYACTFLTDATQYQPYSWLGSVQYNANASGSNGRQVLFSYADINNSSAGVNLSATGINTVSVPNVSNLNLTGSANVQAAVSATRQFSLLLDANIMTNGASASNQQQQATASPDVTNVLTSINTAPGTMPYGVDGFLSSIIQVAPSSQVYTAAPAVTIIDSMGYALNSSTAYPAWGNLTDLQLAQYSQNYSQMIISPPTILGGGSGYTTAPTVAIVDSPISPVSIPISNNSFEQPSLASGVYTQLNGSTANGWTWSGTGSTGVGSNGSAYGFPYTSNGSQFAVMQQPNTISQILSITNAGTYQISFSAVGRPSTATNPIQILVDGVAQNISLGSSVIGTTVSPSSSAWQNFITMPFTLSSGSHTIEIYALGLTVDSATAVDNIALNQVGSGTGSGATATATITNGVVTGINITNGGSGYSAPSITFSGGGGTGATAQFSAANLSPAAAGFTVQAWFNSSNLSSTSGIQTIIDLASVESGATSDNIIVGVNNNQLFMSTYNGSTTSTCTGSTRLASNTWYQVSAVFSRGTANLYLNGALVGSSTSMQLLNNQPRTNNYWAKSNNASNPVWQGQQDELRFWNIALTPAQIQGNWNTTFAGSQPNLIAYYKSDKTSGTTVDDSSGFGNRASLSTSTQTNGPSTSTPVGPYVVSAAGQVFINTNFNYSSGSTPFAINYYAMPGNTSASSYITPLLYTLTSGQYSLVASSTPILLSPGQNSASLSWVNGSGAFNLAVGTTYYFGYRDSNGLADSNGNSGPIQFNNKAISSNNWLYTSGNSGALSYNGSISSGSLSGPLPFSINVTAGPYVTTYFIPQGSATISSASSGPVATPYTPAQVTTTAPGVYYLTGKAAASSGSQPVPLVVLVDGVPVATISSSLQTGSGYNFTSNGLQLARGTHTISFVPQGATAGSSTLSGLTLNFRPLVQSTAPLPLVGTGASAVANLNPNTGKLTSITLTNPGSGYANPVVTVQGDTTATAVAILGVGSNAGTVQSMKLVSGGKYYASAPFVTISDSNGGTGTGASATATITNGVVTGITITNAGSGYKKPVVTISAPTIAIATREVIIPVPNVAISDLSGAGAFATVQLNSSGTLSSIAVGTNTATATANLSGGTIGSLNLTGPGQFYTSAPVVTITDSNGGTGSGATATATVTTGMIIAPPTITNYGSGYSTSPSVTITDPTGTGAVAFASIYGDGTLKSITIANPGSGYTNPVFTLSAPGGSSSNVTATVSYSGVSNYLGGVVTGLIVNNSGSGYSAPVVTIAPPATANAGYVSPTITLPYNSDYAASATAAIGSNGTVSGISISSGGSGYSTAPAVTIGAPGSGGVQAVAVATVINGVVTGITVTNPGSGYSSTPTITIGSPNLQATATAVAGRIQFITVPVGAGGSGYLTAPAVTIIDPSGTGATAATTINSSGVVTSIRVTNPGSGYVNPTISIAAPSAPASAGIIGKIGGLSVLAGGSGYTSAPAVSIIDNPISPVSITIANNSFEQPSQSNGGYTSLGGTTSNGWTWSGSCGVAANNSTWYAPNAPSGTQAAYMQQPGYISQTLTITNAGTYQISFSAVGRPSTYTNPIQILVDNVAQNITLGSSLIGTTVSPSSSAWQNFTTMPFTLSSGSHTIKINALGLTVNGSGVDASTAVDNIALNQIGNGTGTGATGTATISGGKVTGVTVSNAGSGYSNPVVSFAGGGSTGASATAWLNFSSTSSNTVAIANGGYGYAKAPTVQVLDSNGGTGSGVTGTATLNSSGVVTAVTLAGSSTAFSSYTAPVLVISPPSGINATAGIIGKIGGFSVLAGGSNYTSAPTVTITDSNGGTGSGATATATFSGGKVTGITVNKAGSGYKDPVVSFSGGGGNGASATAWLAFSSTTSNTVSISNGGAGYTTAPTVQVLDSNGGTGTGVTGTATINSSGVVTAITLAGSFSSYTAPVLVIASPPTSNPATAIATVDSTVSGPTVIAGGSGYTTAPTVTIVDANGGTGSGATATATVVNNVITGITITNPGSGYSNPVITLSAPTGTTAQAAAMNWSVQLTGGGQFYSQPPVVTVTAVTNNFGPATSTFPVGTTTDVNYDQVYINALYPYTSANQPVSVNFYSASSGHFITPLLFTLNNGVYTLVASSTAKSVSSGNNTASLSWSGSSGTFAFAANTNYYVGFKDGSGISDPTGYSGCIEWSNTSSNPNNQWLFTSQGNTNSSGVPALGSLSFGNTFAEASGSTFSLSVATGTRNYSFNVTSSSYVPGPGSGATATATLENGVVTGITINNPGSGYTSAPIITFANPVNATAVLTQGVMGAPLTYAGMLYQNPPTVTITDASGNGTGATGYAVLVGGQVNDIVITNYGTGYVSPVITLSAPTVDISQVPNGPSAVTHTFYFLDGSSWTANTTSNSGISIQYQLIDQLTQLDDAAANGLTGGNGSTAANYYNLQAYLTPLLSSTAPTYAQTGNLGIIFPSTPNPNSTNTAYSPLLWNMSAGGGDPIVTQALFSSGQWNMATVGAVGLGNIDLVMNLAGNSGSPGFTGTAQVGYVDVTLNALDFSPDIDFTLDTTPGTFLSFGDWQGILGSDSGLTQYATTTSTINSYDLTLSAQVSSAVSTLLNLPTSGNVMPEVTFTASGGNGVYTGSFSNAEWGNAEGMLYISQANIGTAFEQIATALAYTDTSSYLGASLPFVNGTLQDLTSFSDYFVNYLEDELISGAPTDLDSLIDWVNDNSNTFTLAFVGSVSFAGSSTSGQGLYLTPVNWSDSVSTTSQFSFNLPTYAALAGGLPASQNMLAYTVVPPNNTGDVTVTADVAWQAPMGVLFTQTGTGASLGYGTQGYIAGSSSTNAWNLSDISVQGENLDFQGTLGTLAVYFESDTYDTANVAVSGGQIATSLGQNMLASSVVTSTLGGTVSGGYNANLPVYYPTSTCYSGNFNISGTSGGSSAASLYSFLNQAALFNANLSGGAISSLFTTISAGSNYLTTLAGGTTPTVLITDAAGQGSGATATATVNSNGTISLTLTSGGSGYISPVVSVIGGNFNPNTPTGTPSVTLTLPDIDNNDIAALSLANAISDPNIFQQGLGGLQGALQSAFTQSMAYTSQIIVGTGTSEFSAAFGLYGAISDYLDQNLTPFVPTCDQNATASATATSGEITAITVITTGESYQSAPTVTITDNAGTGSGATATAKMASDGNGGYYVASIKINSAGSGYQQPIVSIGSPSASNQSADEQLYNEACTVYNLVLNTTGLVLDPTQPQNSGYYIPNGQTASTIGQIPLFFDAYGNQLLYNSGAQFFTLSGSTTETTVQSVQFPLIANFTLEGTSIPFSFGMPGIPLTINNPADLNLIESGSTTVNLTFGIDALNGFYIVPVNPSNGGTQFSGTVAAGPDSDFTTTMTLGLLSGTMTAGMGEIFTMPFTTTMNDPNYNPSSLNNQLTLAEINSLDPMSLFQTTLAIPTVGLNVDMTLQVAGGGIAAALPSIGNTMSITWTPGQGSPQLSYNNFYIDLGSFISNYMGAIAPQLTPITNGVQPILNALNTQTPVLGDIIGGDTSLLGLANRFGGANLGFVQALDAIVDMLGDVTSAVNYINANPGQSFIVPLDVVATFANDYRTAASGLSKPQQITQVPSQAQVVASMNNFMSQYANSAAANFTEPASRVLNQDYGVSGGLGISFDILDPVNIIGLITGQTVDIFHIDFPSLSANFSIDESFPLDPPLYMTFGGGVSAGINLSLGMDSAGLEQWFAATVDGTQGLSASALEGLAQDIIMQGFFVDGANTDISTSGYLSMGVQLNGGIAKAGVTGNFNVGMNMTPNADSSGRLDLQEMIQLAGADFSNPLNLFDFDLTGTVSADAYLQLWLPFKWRQVWSHNFGSYTLFNVQNNPAPPTESAASYGSLYLNMGPTAGRRSQTKGMTDEHFEIRHLGGVAGDETLSVQLYDPKGNPQYVDSNGNPKPQIYYHVDKVVGIAGAGDDTIDCTGVLSPTHIEGGDGKDSILGGLGLNYLDGGNGPDRITGGPLADTILGGDGTDNIQGGGGTDSIDGGQGDDSMDSPHGGLMIPFGDRFGSDRITAAMIAGSTLDFSQVTQNLKVTLGTVNTIQVGKNYSITWTGAGPAKIILGKGEDNIAFTKGYSSVVIDSGLGRDRFEIFDFETGQTVTIDAAGKQPDNTFLVKTGSTGEVVADQTGLHYGAASFNIDWTDVRKLTLHETGAKIDLDFANSGVTKILAFGNEVGLTSGLKAQDVRLEAASLVSVQADIIAAKGGEIALVAGPNGAVKIGTSGDAKLSTLNGNIDVSAPVAYLGGKASTVTTTHTNGNFIVEADQTIRTAMAPTPFFNTSVPAITVGQGGSLRAWSTDGTALTAPLTPFMGYQGVPRFNIDSDLNGDGIADMVSVPQPGVAPHMVVFSGKDMSVLRSVYVFDPRFLGGINVTTGDVDANGVADIILAADAGATPHVVVISGGTWEVMASFYAFDKSFKGGLRLATADADGDGVLDIITSTASGPISHVVAFGNLGQSVISSFYAFPEAVKNGVEIAAADLNNDNIAELILGTSGGTSQQVGIYRGNPNAIDYFMAYENWNGDVRVGSVKTAGKTLITTGPGLGAGPNVRTFDPDSYDLLDSFFAGNEYDLSGVTL